MQIINDFSIEPHFFPLISVSANPKFKRIENQTIEAEIESNITVHDVANKSDRLFVDMRVKMDGDKCNAPYLIDVVCGCFISTSLDISQDEIKDRAANICFKVLYSAVRELVLTLTARQPWGQFSIGIDEEEITSSEKPLAAVTKPVRKRSPKK